MKLEIYLEQVPWGDITNCYFILRDQNGSKKICSPMVMEFKEYDISLINEPTLRFNGEISHQFFPALVDALAKSGYRYESSDAGELKATKLHLRDLQLMLMKSVEIRG